MHRELLKLLGWEGLYKWVMKSSVDVTPFLFDKHFWLLFQISCSLGQCFPLTVIISIVWNCLCGSLISWHLFFSYLVELGFLSACRCTHRSWHQWPGRNCLPSSNTFRGSCRFMAGILVWECASSCVIFFYKNFVFALLRFWFVFCGFSAQVCFCFLSL